MTTNDREAVRADVVWGAYAAAEPEPDHDGSTAHRDWRSARQIVERIAAAFESGPNQRAVRADVRKANGSRLFSSYAALLLKEDADDRTVSIGRWQDERFYADVAITVGEVRRLAALDSTPAQAEGQEAVAWISKLDLPNLTTGADNEISVWTKEFADAIPLFTTPPDAAAEIERLRAIYDEQVSRAEHQWKAWEARAERAETALTEARESASRTARDALAAEGRAERLREVLGSSLSAMLEARDRLLCYHARTSELDHVIDEARAALATTKTQDGHANPLPQDVVLLVIAARDVAYGDPTREALRDLDRAAEAFASRVPWDDEPDDEDDGRSGEPAASAIRREAEG